MINQKTKRCPKCNREYSKLSNYCSKCGIELEAIPNKCSEMKSSLCKTKVYQDDDMFCEYCGAPTTYALRDSGGGEMHDK